MQIPRGTSFLVRCTAHDATVVGSLKMQHPSPEATAIWGFDFSDMYCPVGVGGPIDVTCTTKTSWEVRA